MSLIPYRIWKRGRPAAFHVSPHSVGNSIACRDKSLLQEWVCVICIVTLSTAAGASPVPRRPEVLPPEQCPRGREPALGVRQGTSHRYQEMCHLGQNQVCFEMTLMRVLNMRGFKVTWWSHRPAVGQENTFHTVHDVSYSESLTDDSIKCHLLKYFSLCRQSHNNSQGSDKLTQTYMEEKTVNCRWGRP